MKRVFAHIGFSFATALIIINFLQIKYAVSLTFILAAIFILTLILKKTRQAVAIPLSIGSAVLACLVFIFCYYGTYLPESSLDYKNANASFYIVDAAEKKDDSYIYTVKTKTIDLENAPQNIKLRVKSSSKIDADNYQVINGNLSFYSLGDNAYNSYGYFGENIFLSSKLNSYNKTDENIFSINKYIVDIRENIKELFSNVFTDETGGISLALITGDKSLIDEETVSDFRASGTSHIMAVSGIHLAILSGTLYWILKKLRVKLKPRVMISAVGVIFYIFLAGFTKSIIRAGIMMLVLLFARLLKEKSDSLNSLGFATFIICLNPFAVGDTSAVLTVLAVLGILTIYPKLKSVYLPKNKVWSYFYDGIIIGISVFISTLPAMYFFFGFVSILSAFITVIILPFAQGAMIFAVLLILFQWCNPILHIISFPLAFFVFFIRKIIKIPSALGISVVDISDPIIPITIGLVFFFFGISFILKKKGTLKIASILSACLIVVSVFSMEVINSNSIYLKEVFDGNNSAFIVYNNKNALLFGIDSKSDYYDAKSILQSNNRKLVAVDDIYNNEYSVKLAEEYSAENYLTSENTLDSEINFPNVLVGDCKRTNLCDNIAIEKSNSKSVITIYSSSFEIEKTEEKNYKNNDNSSFDTIYKINQDGFYKRRLNDWQK